jgi:hypothetical protein
MNVKRLASEDWTPPVPIHPPRLLGVADGLFSYLTQITTIRNGIRANIAANHDPIVNYASLYRAAEIDAAIRDWTPHWPPGDGRDKVGLLYQQMMWVYLFRTIYPPSASGSQSVAHSQATSHAASPPRRSMSGHESSTHSSPLLASMNHQATHNGGSNHPSRTNSFHEPSNGPSNHPSRTNSFHESTTGAPVSPTGTPQRASSPPPIRRPQHHDQRITSAVLESLSILESFKPSDPVQTLLLIPCLVIGTACFEPSQQERIRQAVKCVRGYTGLRNCDKVAQLLEEVWLLMEQGDWVSVWDWQGVALRHRLDFLCT